MSSLDALLGTLSLAALAWVVFSAAASLALAVIWPLARRVLRVRSPEVRARAALVLSAGPSLVPLVLVALCFAPGVLALLGVHADHCAIHPGHPHLCLAHATGALTGAMALVLVAWVGFASLAGWWATREARGARRAVGALRAGASHELSPGVWCVSSDRPFSLTPGIGRDEIFVSSALAKALAPTHLDAVIEHERAHVRRRDGIRRLLAHALSWPHLPGVRRALLAELALATEQSCDEEAGRRVGDRLCVAEAILAAERLLRGHRAPCEAAGLAFGGSSVPARIASLLAEGRCERAPAGFGIASVLVVALLFAEPVHHATEHLLGLLVGAH